MVRFLLDRGADIDAENVSGWTPLMLASFAGQTKIVNLLVSRGANIFIEDAYHPGKTALTISKEKGFADIVQILEASLSRRAR
jgi:ankyrin repeat protein